MSSILQNQDSATRHSGITPGSTRQKLAADFPQIRELIPAPDPAICFQQLAGLPHVLFLDSALRSKNLGCYSYLTADPFRFLELRESQFLIDGTTIIAPANPMDVIGREMAAFVSDTTPGLPPFQGGAAGVFGYELSSYFERLPTPPPDDIRVPELSVGLYDWVIAWDHNQNRAWIISTGFPELEANRRSRRALARLEQVGKWLDGPPLKLTTLAGEPVGLRTGWEVDAQPGLRSNFEPARYVDVVARAIEYIHAGDCFQVNVAQRLFATWTGDPSKLYLRLRERNAATFAGFFNQGEFILASASPERFLKVDRGQVSTRPIKGTRPRSPNAELDAQMKTFLANSAKDRAENVMIVDLLRNDLGRVCAYGTVRVPALCEVESYAYVHHLVSEVCGQLRSDQSTLSLIQAAFPGGSITGAPKIRAMEIINELEQCARGWYCGSLGFLSFDGAMDTNLLIRSFIIYPGGVQFSVGGGIVADSIPEREYDETWHKARGMLQALMG